MFVCFFPVFLFRFCFCSSIFVSFLFLFRFFCFVFVFVPVKRTPRIYVVMVGHISDMADIYLTWQTYVVYVSHVSNQIRIFRQNDSLYVGMVGHISDNHDIYRATTIYIVVFAPCAFSDIYRGFFCQIEFMVAHMSGLPTYITENGCSYVRHGTIYEQSFFIKKRKWQRICVTTRHMSNHPLKNTQK